VKARKQVVVSGEHDILIAEDAMKNDHRSDSKKANENGKVHQSRAMSTAVAMNITRSNNLQREGRRQLRGRWLVPW